MHAELTAPAVSSGAARRAGAPGASDGRAGFWLDPRTKVLMLVCANVTLLASGYTLAGWILKCAMACSAVALLAAAGRRRVGFGFGAAFLAATALELVGEAGLLAFLGSTSVLAVTVRFLTSLVLQLMPGTVFAYYLFATTKVSEFVAAMERLHLPQSVIIPFAVVFRFFPTVVEEYRSIRDAMRLRGVDWKAGPVALVEYRLVPLIISLVKIGDELAAAAVTRGLGGAVARTSRCRIGFSFADGALAAFYAACALATAAKGAMGW